MRCKQLLLIVLIFNAMVFNANAQEIGVYYYPWWGDGIPGGHTFDETVRLHLVPDNQPPQIGIDHSRSASAISNHIQQSQLGNISSWIVSWWGPNSFEDVTLRNHIVPHPEFGQLKYAIHYESTGRLGEFANPDYSNFVSDFEYIAQNYFDDANYLRINGRPVVVIYLSRVYFKEQPGFDALSQMRSHLQTNFGVDPYIIGDHLFGNVAAGSANIDAITSFDVYGQVFNDGVATQQKIDNLANIYSNARILADSQGVDFVPCLSPGYNDKAVRDGNEPAPRYLQELGPTAFGSVMEAMLQTAVLPNTDDDVEQLFLVNSFNEWHEDTQIEAAIVSPSTNTDDTPTGTELTEGNFYEGYGTRYLDILREMTTKECNSIVEIRWARGTANGNFVGNFDDAMNWDGGMIPGLCERARCDRGATEMTMNSSISVQEIFFGVDESNQSFFIESPAEISTTSNFFASFNSGSNTLMTGGTIDVGGNFLLGQIDNASAQDQDINFTIEAGTLNVSGTVILGDQFDGAGGIQDRNVALNIVGGEVNIGNNLVFAPNGDLNSFLAGANNSLIVRIGGNGVLRFIGNDLVTQVSANVLSGLIVSDEPGELLVQFDGNDTVVTVDSSGVVLGDVNLDGMVNLLDVAPFVELISSGVFQAEADTNQDGMVNLLDVAPFIDLLAG